MCVVCELCPPLQHYDDKVDLWSIGALLYKVLVGQCGFYAVSSSAILFTSCMLLTVHWLL